MKRVFGRITAAILILGSLGACAPDPDTAQEPGSMRVLAPLNDSDGKYSLKISELKGIEDSQTLTGQFVRFFLSPRIANNHLEGIAPKTRFIRNGTGDYIPSDDMTQQLVSIYFHMQKLAALDEELGAGGVNTWPRDVGVGVRVKGAVANNAFYDGKTDSMLFVPYTEEGLPIAINGGILAHEHFHSLFYKLVVDDQTAQAHDRGSFLEHMGVSEAPSPRQRVQFPSFDVTPMDDADMQVYYQTAMTRGLNEGLADFWGWMYTGDPDFIVQSIPMVRSTRTLKVADEKAVNSLPREETVARDLRIKRLMITKETFGEFITGYSYSLGTQFSRALKRYSDIYAQARGVDSLQARKEIAKMIVQTLPLIRQDLNDLNLKSQQSKIAEGVHYTSELFLKAFMSNAGELHQEECEFLTTLFNNSRNDGAGVEYVCKQQGDQWKVITESIKVKDEPLADGSLVQ